MAWGSERLLSLKVEVTIQLGNSIFGISSLKIDFRLLKQVKDQLIEDSHL